MNLAPAVFEAKDLTYKINSTEIIKDINFRVLQGEYSAVIGPNGGGKTTLIRLLLGLEKSTSGSIKLFGKKQKNFKSWNKIGYVPQRVSQVDQYFPATVEEVVKMGRTSLRGLFSRESQIDRDAVSFAMEKMDVQSLKDKLIGELSGGQRQRVLIARALASNPSVLILDEPNTGVDMVSQNRFYKLLRDLNRNDGMTIIFITHDVGVIADDIQTMLCINQTLLACNNPHEVLSCIEMSKLYGIDAHLIHHHHH